MEYIKVTIYTNDKGLEYLTSLLYDKGIQSLEIMDKNDFEEFMKSNVRTWDMVDEDLMASMLSAETKVSFYLENNDEATALIKETKEELKVAKEENDFGRLKLESEIMKDEDWENSFKKYYKALRVGEHILIKPTWEEADIKDGDVVVELDPGMAFGTGTHESTHMCLEFLEKMVKKGDKVLDIGTGSGILGIAALKLGAESVTAVDIDPLAVKIAKENAQANGFGEDKFSVLQGDLADKVKGEYDLVLANIVADIICELAKKVSPYIKNDGKFITSGIIDFKADNVREALKSNNIKINEEKNMGDWYSFLCEKE